MKFTQSTEPAALTIGDTVFVDGYQLARACVIPREFVRKFRAVLHPHSPTFGVVELRAENGQRMAIHLELLEFVAKKI